MTGITNGPGQVLKLDDLLRISDWQHNLPWAFFRDGVDIYRLYGVDEAGPKAALLRFHPGSRVALHEHLGYEHILVLSGSQVDENSRSEAGALIVNPPGTRHSVLSEDGCIVLAIYEKPVAFVAAASPPVSTEPAGVLLAVNGTLMRGLELNRNLLAANAAFIRETSTAPAYRLWSIGDRHPAMVRVREHGMPIAVEVWSVPVHELATLLLNEPPGLSVGKVTLTDGSEVLGVLGEPILCESQQEITAFGGWRAYVASLNGERRS